MESIEPCRLSNPRAVLGHNQPPESPIARQLNGIERAVVTYEDLRNDGLRMCIVQATTVAREILQGGPRAWTDFINEPRWGDKAPPPNGFKKYLYHVFRWIFGLEGAAAKNASLYARAVHALLKEGVELDELEEHLKRSTLKKLAAAGALAKTGKRQNPDSRTGSRKHKERPNKAGAEFTEDIKTANEPEIVRGTAMVKRTHYKGSVHVEFVGNTQPLLGLETNKDFVLRGRVVALGNSFKIVIHDAFLDPNARE
ncbi:hypothetical protein LHFGNBLO_000054 [Mesorhizobium sp. AR10]|uniref:hypothetical protein n=1 Tax=Mesorhizobium sp. AR10 TaxID=2865839 RepID=UPI00215E71D3|nr:hypothetical protein [Mesorhizobium sp. AR10]UVK38770.1 hypothetical protein LHFGNBLO_000054 [Mesorhizobium sp. AR10]